jgi:hypothetical protein
MVSGPPSRGGRGTRGGRTRHRRWQQSRYWSQVLANDSRRGLNYVREELPIVRIKEK